MKMTGFKILVGFLVLCSLAMAAYLFSVYRETSKPRTPSQTVVTPAPVPKQDPGRAFANITGAPSSATKGGSWKIDIDTNAWATCSIDLYTPNEQFFTQDKIAAKASFLSPGKFIWTWKIPVDADSGRWVARVLCGTFDNLAATDQAVDVR